MIILIIHIIVSYDQNITLIFYVKDGFHVRLWHVCDIRLVLTLSPRDSTLQYKRCAHLWNNFPCIITLGTPNIFVGFIGWLKYSDFSSWKYVLWFYFTYSESDRGSTGVMLVLCLKNIGIIYNIASEDTNTQYPSTDKPTSLDI